MDATAGTSPEAASAAPALMEGEVQQPGLADIDSTTINVVALARVVKKITNVTVSADANAYGLTKFLKANIELYATRTGRSLEDELIVGAWHYITDPEAPSQIPEFYRQPDLYLALGKVLVDLQKEAGLLMYEQPAPGEPAPPPLPPPPNRRPARALKPQTPPVPKRYELTPTDLARLERLRQERGVSRTEEKTTEKPVVKRTFRPLASPVVSAEALQAIDVPESLAHLNRLMQLPVPDLKLFAVHIGMAESPGRDVQVRTIALKRAREKLVDLAMELNAQAIYQPTEYKLDVEDTVIINCLVPPWAYDRFVGEVIGFADFHADLVAGKYRNLPNLTADNLKEKIRGIFENKLPGLLRKFIQ